MSWRVKASPSFNKINVVELWHPDGMESISVEDAITLVNQLKDSIKKAQDKDYDRAPAEVKLHELDPDGHPNSKEEFLYCADKKVGHPKHKPYISIAGTELSLAAAEKAHAWLGEAIKWIKSPGIGVEK